ncbi:MAG TPA: hypothetical protein VE954_31755 [Oligoflexus sp.]|uniref:hypothetical protein n=1 Tax=Oligoflexus sp. TaxID=1971216 RepID=UPI002D4F3614|nr:hypothetical protein [Oligoflexus sp.]HYX37700.1 hypothetical protein [Oligoflexus sp.]
MGHFARFAVLVLLFRTGFHGALMFADQIKGPVVQMEQAEGQVDEDDHAADRRRMRAYGLFPLLDAESGHNLIVSLDAMEERRHHRLPGHGVTERDFILSLGGLYMYKVNQEKFVPFLWLARYQDPAQPQRFSRMDQLIFGAYGQSLLPYADSWRGKTTIAYRIRQYPMLKHFLFYLGEEIFIGPNWEVLLSTSGVRLDWHRSDNTLRFYAGFEGEGRDYAGSWSGQTVWKIGRAVTGYVGARVRVAGPLYVSTEFGLQQERMQYTNAKAEDLLKYETRFNPWAKISIETWLDKVQLRTQ